MYQLTSAIAKPIVGDGHWLSVDIGDVAMCALYNTYSKVWAILTNAFLTAPVALDLELIRATYGGESITFNQVMAAIGNQALPTTTTIPQIKPRFAKYQDAIRAGYKVQPITPTLSADAIAPEADKTYLLLTRPDTDYKAFYEHCLVNVNGFFHLTDANSQGIRVIDGMKSRNISKENQIGFVSFAGVASLQVVPITSDMIYKQNPDQVMRERAHLDIGQDVTDRTVFLVLGGYLHSISEQSGFTQVGTSLFKVDFAKIPMLERYMESKRYLDLSSLKLSSTNRNENQIAVDELMSDAALTAYLTLSQSFFVVLDNSSVFFELDPLRVSAIPDIFITDEKPIYPLITGVGRLANYWQSYDCGSYALDCTDTLRPRPLYRTANPDKMHSVTDQRIPERPYYPADAYFLKIGIDLS